LIKPYAKAARCVAFNSDSPEIRAATFAAFNRFGGIVIIRRTALSGALACLLVGTMTGVGNADVGRSEPASGTVSVAFADGMCTLTLDYDVLNVFQPPASGGAAGGWATVNCDLGSSAYFVGGSNVGLQMTGAGAPIPGTVPEPVSTKACRGAAFGSPPDGMSCKTDQVYTTSIPGCFTIEAFGKGESPGVV
jgi:hypothetical protein